MPAPRDDLRLDVPTLEPDPALVARLAAVAAAGCATRTRRFAGLRVGVATAGLVAVSVGGAWAAATWVTPQAPSPPVIQPSDSEGTPEPGDTPDTPGSDQAPPPGRSPSPGRVGDLPSRVPERGTRGPEGAHRPPGHGGKGQGNRPDDVPLPGQGHGAGPGQGGGHAWGHGPGQAPGTRHDDRRADATGGGRANPPGEGSDADRASEGP